MNTNVNRIGNAPQFVLMPKLTDVIGGDLSIDVEMPPYCLIDMVEVIVTSGFPASTTIKAGYLGDTPVLDAFLASNSIASTGVVTSSIGKRMGTCASDNMLRITVSATSAAANAGEAYIKIWHIFEPNSAYVDDPDYDNTPTDTHSIIKPSYLYL